VGAQGSPEKGGRSSLDPLLLKSKGGGFWQGPCFYVFVYRDLLIPPVGEGLQILVQSSTTWFHNREAEFD
jgi:hypothetical protein